MALTTGLEASAREHALKMKIRSLKVQVCKLKAKMREVNRPKKTRKAGVNKESVMKQMKKLLPAKAYAFVSTQIHMSQLKIHGPLRTKLSSCLCYMPVQSVTSYCLKCFLCHLSTHCRSL